MRTHCKECKSLYDKTHSQIPEVKIKNSAKDKIYKKIYTKTLIGRYNIYKRNAKKRQIPFNISLELFEGITELKCYYCGCFSGDNNFCGVDRINSNEGYDLGNCLSCCDVCNYMKLCMSFHDFCKKIETIHNNLKKREINGCNL